MNRITPIVLLLIVVAAGSYVAFWEARRETPSLESPTVLKATNAEAEAVREMTVTRTTVKRAGEAPVVETLDLQRGRDGAWRLVQPVQGLARDAVINSLVHDALFLPRVGGEIRTDPLNAKGLSAYGLEKPRIVVKIRSGEGAAEKEWQLLVGNQDPTKQFAYVKGPLDTGVSVVPAEAVEAFVAPLGDWRERKFLRFDMNHATTMSLRSPMARLDLRRQGTSWLVTKPFTDRVDWIRFEYVLRALGEVEARDFMAESVGRLEPLGLTGSAVRVEVSFTRDDNTTTTLLLGAPCPRPVGTVYAKLENDPTIYAVDEALVSDLTFPSEALRDRSVIRISSSNATEFDLDRPGARLVVKKQGARWKIVEPVTADAEDTEVDAFFRELSGLQVVRWPNDAPDNAALERYGLDAKSRATLTVRQADKPEQVLYIGKVDPKQKDLYLQRAGSRTVYTVSDAFAARAVGAWLDFRSRKVAAMSKYEAEKLVIRRPGGDFVIEKGADAKWRMTSPAGAPGDEINIGNVLDELNDLSAVRLLVEKAANPADYGLDKPVFEVSVDLRAGKDKPVETKTLLIGREIRGEGWTAEVKGEDLVWVASNVLVDHLRAEMRKRLIWEIRRPDIQAMTWQAGSEKVVARVEGGWWRLVEPSGAKLDPAVVDEIVSPLEGLRVDRYEAYSKEALAKYGLDKPRVTVVLTVEGRDRVFLLGAAKDAQSVYAMVSTDDAIFTVPTSFAASVLRVPLAPQEPKSIAPSVAPPAPR